MVADEAAPGIGDGVAGPSSTPAGDGQEDTLLGEDPRARPENHGLVSSSAVAYANFMFVGLITAPAMSTKDSPLAVSYSNQMDQVTA